MPRNGTEQTDLNSYQRKRKLEEQSDKTLISGADRFDRSKKTKKEARERK